MDLSMSDACDQPVSTRPRRFRSPAKCLARGPFWCAPSSMTSINAELFW